MGNLENLIAALPEKERRGSRLRCLLFTEGSATEVAHRLIGLVAPYAFINPAQHQWMPLGFTDTKEAELGKNPGFLSQEHQEKVTTWWLLHRRGARTPNWDIASTADIEGRKGLILVEAKAHESELHTDGKSSFGSGPDNHARIGKAIEEANIALNTLLPGWALSRDACYQLCNRFAWAWKVASLGVPVILVYLGSLRATEMQVYSHPIADAASWERLVKEHGRGLVPESVWEQQMFVNGTPMRALIRSCDLALPPLHSPSLDDKSPLA